MQTVAYVLVTVAVFAATYVARLLVVKIAWADHKLRPTTSTRATLAVCLGLAAVLIAIPLFLAGGLLPAHPGWASLVALASIVLSAAGFVVLAGAFRP